MNTGTPTTITFLWSFLRDLGIVALMNLALRSFYWFLEWLDVFIPLQKQPELNVLSLMTRIMDYTSIATLAVICIFNVIKIVLVSYRNLDVSP